MSSSETNLVKLSQWDALILESLKSLGWQADELLRRVRDGELPTDDSKFKFDYTRLTELAGSDSAAFEHAVRHGYRIKYNTLRGIASWLLLAYGHEAELNLEPSRESVVAHLTEKERDGLKAVLSYGWVVHGKHDASPETTSTYIIEPLVRG
ncbi:hypothetical protein ACFPES_19605 [Paenibacillus sp. GCM10023248]|uniref:hypothetical protein n=1 Tax=Bacillales TaxID=1385 RepID=UPI002377E8A1|nr:MULTISPECIES: hypothetical protein [Bacillales]MDD9269258.1 hypothetical protein [Paenibacillus sp. MAHUQ-63]MDR6880518.1 hypothetical protein [Bacillus sp. 3255]